MKRSGVIIACEFSGIVRDAFIRRGIDAVSCDLLPSTAPGPHIQGDIRDVDVSGFAVMIAHPPCTYLASSGARWFREPGRAEMQARALDFVRWLLCADVLTDRPWKHCPCEICRRLGVHVIIFRGAERNRRRGFHNLFVFNNQLQGHLDRCSGREPVFQGSRQ